VFLPYLRDDSTLARPWARPGTAGLEHRIGGLEKENITGNVSYDPDNHELMTKIRAEKVDRVAQEIPPLTVYGADEGDLLVVGWGSTRVAIEAAVDRANAKGLSVGAVHLRFVRPLPNDLGKVLGRFKKVLVPELNNGQLIKILRDRYLLPIEGFNKIQGMPFGPAELLERFEQTLAN